VIVGVSDESKELLETFVKEKGVTYPVVQAPDAMDAFSATAYPTYFLIGADGKIVANDHPSEEQIVAALKHVRFGLDLPSGSTKLKPLSKAWGDGKRAEVAKQLAALAADASLSAEETALVADTKARFDRELADVAAEISQLGAGPDYLNAQERLETIRKDFAGLDAATKADAELKRFQSDAAIKKELSAAKALKLLRARFDPSRTQDRRKLLEGLRDFAKKHKGTHAATMAEKAIVDLSG
jgi:hypothetical protein